jgi:phosphoserine aminotransferase
MSVNRVHNFGPGPAALPLPVLERVRDELLDFGGTGMSILESSHRGPAYGEVHRRASQRLRSLLGGAENHEILFMTGGARTQFSAVAMNLLPKGARAGYLTTGRWSELALEAAARVGAVTELWCSGGTGHDRVPAAGEVEIPEDLAYLHYTTNNTIYGTQHAAPPAAGSGAEVVPLVADMSSDILGAPLDVDRFGVLYAGAQKNIGPAGVTVVLVRRDLLERSPPDLPDTLSYARMAAKDSLLNTPPVFAIYVLDLVLEHLEENGGLAAVEKRNAAKASRLYAAIDGSDGFYRGHAQPGSRSRMNVTFRLPTPELEQEFLAGAAAESLLGLKGHRSVGGIRASIYNAVEPASVEVLVEFMAKFAERQG